MYQLLVIHQLVVVMRILATSDVSASGNTSTGGDGKETNLINKLVKTGKFTEAEAKQFVSKSMQNGPDVTSTSDQYSVI
jgi:polyhydroxyalkanoate synthesis regulator phasin